MIKEPSFPRSARFLHWAMAALIISMLFLGVSMIRSLAPWQNSALLLHKSFGVLVLALAVARIANRLRFEPPSLPSDLAGLQRMAANISHWLLYAGMVTLPLSGWAMQSAGGIPLRPFGLISLPSIAPENIALYGLFREAHFLIAWGLSLIVLIHIGAALHHGLVRRDGVLRSMLSPSKGGSRSVPQDEEVQ